nr:reverse transcriptase domain-containing protein [Tanacetum cinerariifolium]
MPPRMRTQSAGRPAAKSLGGGTGVRVGRCGRREGANGGAPDFSTIIAQQLQNLLPAMLGQVDNQGNFGNQNGNVVNENVQENDGNVIVNGIRIGCSYMEFLACNPKEYDGKGGVVVLTQWIEKIKNVQDMSGCSIDQKMKYTSGSFVAPQEPIVFNQEPYEDSSQSPPQIDHQCCYGCGDPLDEPFNNQNVDELPQTLTNFHPTRYSGDEDSFAHDSTPNFVNESPNIFHPPPQTLTNSYEFYRNDAHYSNDCPPQVPSIYNSEPYYNQDFNFLQNFQIVQQQCPCCESCGGPHENFQCQLVIFYEPCCGNYGGLRETFQCQPMNYYEPTLCYESNYSNYSGFDQFKPPQPPVIHQPAHEISVKILHDHENVINSVQTFLRKFDHFSFFKTPKVLLLAWDRVFEIKNDVGNKQYKPDDVQELFRKLLNDVQSIHEELAEYINIPSWNHPALSSHDDDDYDGNYTIPITPKKPDNSLSMRDEHLNTILVTKSDEVIKSSIEDLVPIPSESEGILDNTCDVPFRDNSPPLDVFEDQFEEFSDSNDDSTSIDDDYFSIENINYIELSPLDSELVSLE